MTETDHRFEELTIAEFQAAVRRGAVTSHELTQWYLDRIATVDPELRSIVTVSPTALDEARRADEHFAVTGQFLGALHGVPVLVKDQADTAGLRTTYGSQLFAEHVPTADSTLVTRLREAGAVILAKTAMNDLACGYSSHSTVTGTTANPYDLNRDTGGSSAGTGAAVAANLGLVGIGEDTGGSIRVPSSFCNLFGIRVAVGRISRHGLQGLVPNQDTPGPMTRTVADLATLLDVLVGYDENDPEAGSVPPRTSDREYRSRAIAGLDWTGLRVGVLESGFDLSDDPEAAPVTEAVRGAIERLRGLGADVVPGITIPDLDRWAAETSLYGTVSRSVLNEFFAQHGAPVSGYDEFLASGAHNPALSTFRDIADGSDDPSTDPAYLAARYAQTQFRSLVLDVMARHGVDLLVYPTVRTLPPRFDAMDAEVSVPGFPTNTVIGSQAVLPAMSVPVGLSDAGVPVGMEILARPFAETCLVEFAAAWEAATQPRVRPRLGSADNRK
ncbi:amidase [Citricoccus sp. GCM10030269]|uniref:amidase n=1 Tax=Citricoccus sp. GCM10030269 TaxID=3273388 RepID=UPI003614E6B7